MHASVHSWVGQKVKEFGLAEAKTLEVGSRDINGSVRDHFAGEYVGVDMSDGPGVDIVASSHALPFPDRSFDCVVCTEMLEHDVEPWRTVVEIARVLRPGGHLLLTARGIGFPLHDYPGDHWRFSCTALVALLGVPRLAVLEAVEDPQVPGVFCLAVKP